VRDPQREVFPLGANSSLGNVHSPNPPWPEYVMHLVATCVNVIGTDEEGWHWAELEEAMRVEEAFRGQTEVC
jgi:hypothetical protein